VREYADWLSACGSCAIVAAGAIPILRDFDSFQEKSNFLISRPKILEKSP
jgi:hypothetical protein